MWLMFQLDTGHAALISRFRSARLRTAVLHC